LNAKIVVTCDKYKDSLSALQVCSIVKKAILEVDSKLEVIISPMADGGEGTVDTLVESHKGKYIYLEVMGPTGDTVKSSFGIIESNTAVIEMSAASGLWLVPIEKRNPLYTTTFGTGQLIKKALDLGCTKIIIGIGGSATTDAGMGAAQALGVKFYDKKGNILGFGGKELINIASIDTKDINPNIKNAKFFVASDVKNPLYGPDGAAYIYGPQKGADREDVEILDKGLRNFAYVIKKETGKDIEYISGAGAAGGLGAGLVVFLDAKIKPGTEVIIDATSLEEKIRNADLIITGEGSMDNQTFYGKSSYGVALLAKKYKVPVVTINGSVNIDYDKIDKEKQSFFAGNFSILNKPMSLDYAISNAERLISFSSKELVRFYLTIISRIKSNNLRTPISYPKNEFKPE